MGLLVACLLGCQHAPPATPDSAPGQSRAGQVGMPPGAGGVGPSGQRYPAAPDTRAPSAWSQPQWGARAGAAGAGGPQAGPSGLPPAPGVAPGAAE